MKFDSYCCEHCKKTTMDYMKDGWLTVKELTKYKGRDKDGIAISEIYLSTSLDEHHFCQWKCLMSFRKKRKK